MSLNLTLTVKEGGCRYITEAEWQSPGTIVEEHRIEAGAKVEYVSHVYGGMVKVRHNAEVVIIVPGSTVELSV